MAIALGYTNDQCRLAAMENEIDAMRGRPPRNRYTCTVCHGERVIDESYHGSPEFRPCSYCDGGRKIDEANA